MSNHCILAIFMSVMIILTNSNGYTLGGGANTFGCCPLPCLSKAASCDCTCGFPALPQLPQFPPQLPPPFVLPQFPAYPSGSYVTPNGNNIRHVGNGYLQQQLSSYQTPLSISKQLHPSYQGTGAQGYGAKQFEQLTDTASGYATGPYSAGNANFGDYSYSLPQTGQNDYRFGAQPFPGIGQYVPGPFNNAPQSDISDNPVAVTVGTIGIGYNSSPATGEYGKKTKHF